MFFKIEPSGTCERKGLVQVRLDFILDEGDYGYEKCRVEVPERALTEKEQSDTDLAEKVPTVTVSAPFHVHFIYVSPTVTDKEILDIGERFLKEAYGHWREDRIPPLVNAPITLPNRTQARVTSCLNRVDAIKVAVAADLMERKV